MFIENGQETLVQFFKDGEEIQIAVDDESYARMINAGYEVGREIMTFSRLPLHGFDTSSSPNNTPRIINDDHTPARIDSRGGRGHASGVLADNRPAREG